MTVYGQQQPRIMHVPPYVDSSGDEAIALADASGLHLDPWQQLVLREGLGERSDGSWSAFEVSVLVSRQNGKGAIIEARILAGLFLFGEQLIIHTAHEVKTAKEAFLRIQSIIDNCDDLKRKVKKVTNGKGEEGIEVYCNTPGHKRDCVHRLKFLSRTHSSGRGFSADCLILDESMILDKEPMGALLPTMSARDNPQVWYFGSAGIGDKSSQLAELRNRALSGTDDSLAYFEWSTVVHDETCLSTCTDHRDVSDRLGWLEANPAVGYRLTLDYIDRERRALGPLMFARERLGVGDYPEEGVGDSPISMAEWTGLTNRDSTAGPDVVFAIEVPPDRGSATIAAFSISPDGWGHVELVDRRKGTQWLPERVAELKRQWNPIGIGMDARGPAASLLMALADEEVVETEDYDQPDKGDLYLMSVTDMQQACGQLVDAVRQEEFRHLGDEILTQAVAGACVRAIGDAWVFTRRKSSYDVAPLVAVTIARYVYFKWYELVTDYDVFSSVF